MPIPLTRKLALIAGLALIYAALTISAAPATNTLKIKSTIVMRQHSPAFHGRVESPNHACVENRLVKLFRKRRNGGLRLLGKTHSDGAGKWAVIVDRLSSGAYSVCGQATLRGHRGDDLRLPARQVPPTGGRLTRCRLSTPKPWRRPSTHSHRSTRRLGFGRGLFGFPTTIARVRNSSPDGDTFSMQHRARWAWS
jgi:hypothetical protein